MLKKIISFVLSTVLITAAEDNQHPLDVVTTAKPVQHIILGYLGSWNKIIEASQADNILHWIAYSPDSKYLVCCYENQTIDLYDLMTGSSIVSKHPDEPLPPIDTVAQNKIIAGSKLEIMAIKKIAHNRKVIAVLGERTNKLSYTTVSVKQVKIFSSSGSLEHVIEKPNADSAATYNSQQSSFPYVYSPKRTKVVTGYIDTSTSGTELTEREVSLFTNLAQVDSSDNNIHVFSSDTELFEQKLSEHTDKVHKLLFSQDGKYMISGSYDKTIKLWDGNKLTPMHAVTDLTDAPSVLAISPDNNYIAAGSTDKKNKSTIEIWHNQAEDLAPTKK